MRRIWPLFLLLLLAAAPDRRAELTLTEARAQATGAAVARLTARIAAAESRTRRLDADVAALDHDLATRRARLATEQAALMPALAALESLSRRPPALLMLRPASAGDAARTALTLDAMLPGIRARTRGLRDGLAAAARVRERLAASRAALLASRAAMDRDVRALTALGSRLAARAASLRELLDGVGAGEAAGLRLALAWPAAGRVETPFGAPDATGMRASGLTLRTAPGAAIVAPAAGRVAFAGPFRTYGPIVIVEHGGGVVSLIAGFDRIDAAVGAALEQGQPLGQAGDDGKLYIEVRAGGRAVDPRPWFTAAKR